MFLFYEIAAGGTIKNWDVDDIEENGLRWKMKMGGR